jgi:hypothetical protein
MLFLLALISFFVSLGIAHASTNLLRCALIGVGLYTILPTVLAALGGYTFIATNPFTMLIGLLWSGLVVVIPVVIIALCRPR